MGACPFTSGIKQGPAEYSAGPPAKMTEYETATLASQAAQIELSRAGLWVAIAQVGVGLLQAASIAGERHRSG